LGDILLRWMVSFFSWIVTFIVFNMIFFWWGVIAFFKKGDGRIEGTFAWFYGYFMIWTGGLS
jgi:hypothetical protein